MQITFYERSNYLTWNKNLQIQDSNITNYKITNYKTKITIIILEVRELNFKLKLRIKNSNDKIPLKAVTLKLLFRFSLKLLFPSSSPFSFTIITNINQTLLI